LIGSLHHTRFILQRLFFASLLSLAVGTQLTVHGLWTLR